MNEEKEYALSGFRSGIRIMVAGALAEESIDVLEIPEILRELATIYEQAIKDEIDEQK